MHVPSSITVNIHKSLSAWVEVSKFPSVGPYKRAPKEVVSMIDQSFV